MQPKTCAYCGDTSGDRKHACNMRVIFLPSAKRVQDVYTPAERGLYSGKTLDEYREKHPDAVVMAWDEAHAIERAEFIKPVSEITAEQFDDALNVLPPCKWTMEGAYQSFHVSELVFADIANWFAKYGARYFRFDDKRSLTHREVMQRVREFIEPPTTH